jgi:hypothetical protein
MYYAIYPERRAWTDAEIIAWAADSWATDAPRTQCTVCGAVTVAVWRGVPVVPPLPGEYAASDSRHPCLRHPDAPNVPLLEGYEPCPTDVAECAAYLADKGLITFRRTSHSEG